MIRERRRLLGLAATLAAASLAT
ncbi:MAG: hypothetical protein RL669_713, partial [Pseudomonadota bacterium]